MADYVAGFESGFNSVASAQRHDGRLFPELSAEGDNTASDFFCYLNGKLPHQLRIFSLDHSGYFSDGHPVLSGSSRKRFVRATYEGWDIDRASADAARRAVASGASIVRVHDVAETARALR